MEITILAEIFAYIKRYADIDFLKEIILFVIYICETNSNPIKSRHFNTKGICQTCPSYQLTKFADES
ncbi:MAG: hypothetical protein ACTHME_04020 [Candidatus Nitrosocosmicus sp.]